jgi:hypothetical protein
MIGSENKIDIRMGKLVDVRDRLGLVHNLSFFMGKNSFIEIAPSDYEKISGKMKSFRVKSHTNDISLQDFNLFDDYKLLNKKIFSVKPEKGTKNLIIKFLIETNEKTRDRR